jgi:hypothetical protein
MTPASRAEFREDLLRRVPRWYVPAVHLVAPAIAGVALAALALSAVHDLRPWQLAFVPVFWIAGNAIEWHAHRGLLHRRTRFLEVLYEHHTPMHHKLFVADAMAIHSARELRFVLLPAYGLFAILIASSPVALVFVWLRQPNLAALWIATGIFYVLTYEWLHLAYHLPEASFVGRLPVVRRLRRHHQLHHSPHLMQRWNFNVTVPLWDHLRGTAFGARPARPPGTVSAPALARRAR